MNFFYERKKKSSEKRIDVWRPLSNEYFVRWLWLPIPFFLIIIIILRVNHVEFVWNPPMLLPTMNLSFLTLNSCLVAFLAAVSYLSGRSQAILFLGCGTLVRSFAIE